MEHRGLSVLDLRFTYEKGADPVLKGISSWFSKGEMTALLGANGSGKSTLIKLLSGVLKPAGGDICLDGKPLGAWERKEAARRIAVVHQNNTAPPDYTVQKLVALGRTPYRKRFGSQDREADAAAVRQALLDTDTLSLAERQVSELSGGQMQRVWLAMALAQQTDILLLDEITTYLDIHYQLELLHLIRELNEKRGITVIMVLHDLNLAMEYCHRAVVMKEGQILSQGTIGEAVTEEVLEQAFCVSAQLTEQNGKKYCVFHRKGEVYDG